jgi:hypothetical protein
MQKKYNGHYSRDAIFQQYKDPSGVAGPWVDDRTADEIIKDIRQSRRSRK